MNKKLEGLMADLEELSQEHKKVALEMLPAESNLCTFDLFALATLNRSVQLTAGFSKMVENNNFISAAPLVRLQLDNQWCGFREQNL